MKRVTIVSMEEMYRFLKNTKADRTVNDDGSVIFHISGGPRITGLGGQEYVFTEDAMYYVKGEARPLAAGIRAFSDKWVEAGGIF